MLGHLVCFRHPLGKYSCTQEFVKNMKIEQHKRALNNPFVVKFPPIARIILGDELFNSKYHSKGSRDKQG